jgi:hypothetical protein
MVVNNICIQFKVLTPRVMDPDPAKSFGSLRIGIHIIAITLHECRSFMYLMRVRIQVARSNKLTCVFFCYKQTASLMF